jgi:twinkle protein
MNNNVCIEKLPHSCGSSDALQVFHDSETNTFNGYCFSCGTYVKDPYNGEAVVKPIPKVKPFDEIEKEIQEIFSLDSTYSGDVRSLKRKYLDYYGFKIGLSRVDGSTPAIIYRPAISAQSKILLGYSAKILETKQEWWVKHKGDAHLFGWDKASTTAAKRLYITEGPEDMVALFQAIKEAAVGTQYENHNPAVVSLTFGASSAVNQLSRLQGDIRSTFKEIVLVFDMDEVGRKAAEDVIKSVFPEAKVVSLPEKDANDCVMKGKSKALHAAVTFNAETLKNTRIVWGSAIHEKAKKPAEWGLSYPWESVTKATRGMRTKETIYLGAAPKMGKSELVDALGKHIMVEHGLPILVAKPEQANEQTYKRMAGKVVGKIFHDPKIEFDEEAYERAGSIIKDKLAMIDLYQHVGWDTMKLDIRAAVSEGIKAVFLDPVTNFTNGVDSGDANTLLQRIAQEFAAMAHDLDFIGFIMCHLRNPDSGLSHDRGGKILSSQFAGSRAMARSCNYMFGLEGNKDPDLPEEQRNIRELVLLEDREFGETGRFPLFWDKHTGLFNEIKGYGV